ncbi:hypothetical protein MANES_04G154450v8 [Manihot esculenta]|uniref:Uncharacterized protein n=1 Tax=Manihot esculenta TaxID=3983 RepID=A0ACB7HVB0_MANES|nr:hypothetical protein MANES_04G154450v8 [Manihot esculenta]
MMVGKASLIQTEMNLQPLATKAENLIVEMDIKKMGIQVDCLCQMAAGPGLGRGQGQGRGHGSSGNEPSESSNRNAGSRNGNGRGGRSWQGREHVSSSGRGDDSWNGSDFAYNSNHWGTNPKDKCADGDGKSMFCDGNGSGGSWDANRSGGNYWNASGKVGNAGGGKWARMVLIHRVFLEVVLQAAMTRWLVAVTLVGIVDGERTVLVVAEVVLIMIQRLLLLDGVLNLGRAPFWVVVVGADGPEIPAVICAMLPT